MTSDGVWKRSLAELAPLAVVQPKAATALEIFPNPANDHFWVETNGEPGWLTVRETLGSIVFSGKIKDSPLEINCQSWPVGMYQVSFLGETARGVQVGGVFQKVY